MLSVVVINTGQNWLGVEMVDWHRDLPTGQSDTNIFSGEVPSSKMTPMSSWQKGKLTSALSKKLKDLLTEKSKTLLKIIFKRNGKILHAHGL